MTPSFNRVNILIAVLIAYFCMKIVSAGSGIKTWRRILPLVFLNGPSPASFSFIFVSSNKHFNLSAPEYPWIIALNTLNCGDGIWTHDL